MVNMDLKFDWRTYRELEWHPGLRGKVLIYTRVPMPGFGIECRVQPGNDGHSYDWMFYPTVRLGAHAVLMPEQQEGRFGKFNEPVEAMADLEKMLRIEVAECLAGRRSIIDRWWPAIMSVLRG